MNIGPAEVLVVLVVALVVLGPARLPDAARSVGRAVSEFRRVTSGLQSEVREAFADPPPSFSPPPPEDVPRPSSTGGPPVASSLPSTPEQAEVGTRREADEPPLS
ncbi:MAG: Sec-independent protein translocase protein TatB [Actinomycetota bacterium]|nr:Sec-independent protein translocase protein TatB [Actinomycetota bacterium]